MAKETYEYTLEEQHQSCVRHDTKPRTLHLARPQGHNLSTPEAEAHLLPPEERT